MNRMGAGNSEDGVLFCSGIGMLIDGFVRFQKFAEFHTLAELAHDWSGYLFVIFESCRTCGGFCTFSTCYLLPCLWVLIFDLAAFVYCVSWECFHVIQTRKANPLPVATTRGAPPNLKRRAA